MNNNSKIISNDVILQEANTVSINLQIKMEKLKSEVKVIYNKLFSSYPDIEVSENVYNIYKEYNSKFKQLSKSLQIFYEYKSMIDFISEIDPNEKICWTSNVFHHIKLYTESWAYNVDQMLYNIFMFESITNIYD